MTFVGILLIVTAALCFVSAFGKKPSTFIYSQTAWYFTQLVWTALYVYAATIVL